MGSETEQIDLRRDSDERSIERILRPPTNSPTPALNEFQAANRLGMKAATLRTWRCRRVGPTFRKFGRAVRYLETDLEQFIQSNSIVNEVRS